MHAGLGIRYCVGAKDAYMGQRKNVELNGTDPWRTKLIKSTDHLIFSLSICTYLPFMSHLI